MLLIIVLKNSWSVDSNILAISCSVSSNCNFCLLVYLVIFCCKVDMIYWGKRNCSKQAVSNVLVRCGGTEAFHGLVIRSHLSLLLSLCPWAVNFSSASQGPIPSPTHFSRIRQLKRLRGAYFPSPMWKVRGSCSWAFPLPRYFKLQ